MPRKRRNRRSAAPRSRWYTRITKAAPAAIRTGASCLGSRGVCSRPILRLNVGHGDVPFGEVRGQKDHEEDLGEFAGLEADVPGADLETDPEPRSVYLQLRGAATTPAAAGGVGAIPQRLRGRDSGTGAGWRRRRCAGARERQQPRLRRCSSDQR